MLKFLEITKIFKTLTAKILKYNKPSHDLRLKKIDFSEVCKISNTCILESTKI
jgi:hypothetical protein